MCLVGNDRMLVVRAHVCECICVCASAFHLGYPSVHVCALVGGCGVCLIGSGLCDCCACVCEYDQRRYRWCG